VIKVSSFNLTIDREENVLLFSSATASVESFVNRYTATFLFSYNFDLHTYEDYCFSP
jgi:hypothetical protein